MSVKVIGSAIETPVGSKKNLNKEHELSVIEQVVMQGDLSKLNPMQRVTYYHRVCESMGLNPYTRPFDYISLNGKLTLYAKKDATEQLRQVKKISIVGLEGKFIDDLYIVTAKATTADGRSDLATGAVSIRNLGGDAKANALMKAETKAKRRVTLSISGMGFTDESEIDSIPSARLVDVDVVTGEINDTRQQSIAYAPPVVNPPVISAPVAQQPAQQPEEPKPEQPKHFKDEGYEEFLVRHGMNLPNSHKLKYIRATCDKSKFNEIQLINYAIKNEDSFMNMFKKWSAENPPVTVPEEFIV